mmetsp:Transcript_4771/g.10621  ORF Transcript_4771/g.10621 Transcript_4771/m.10621 type:complete len:213 (-) Transcript_4771:390-1028(-)
MEESTVECVVELPQYKRMGRKAHRIDKSLGHEASFFQVATDHCEVVGVESVSPCLRCAVVDEDVPRESLLRLLRSPLARGLAVACGSAREEEEGEVVELRPKFSAAGLCRLSNIFISIDGVGPRKRARVRSEVRHHLFHFRENSVEEGRRSIRASRPKRRLSPAMIQDPACIQMVVSERLVICRFLEPKGDRTAVGPLATYVLGLLRRSLLW